LLPEAAGCCACAVLSEEEIADAAANVVPPSKMDRLSRTRRSAIDLSRVLSLGIACSLCRDVEANFIRVAAEPASLTSSKLLDDDKSFVR
jgi:bacterioferritin-associated ferredoxin